MNGLRITAYGLPEEASDPSEIPLFWTKIPGLSSLEGIPSWKISLDLVTKSNQHAGVLLIHRLYSPRELQLDINLITAEFPGELADALERTAMIEPSSATTRQSGATLAAVNL